MEVDDGWRNGGNIEGGGRRKGEGDGFGGWTKERGLVGGIGKRHCECVCCCTALDDAEFGRASRRLTLAVAVGR